MNQNEDNTDIGLDETYGKNLDAIVEYVMNAPKRPLEIQEKFNSFYKNLSDEKFDECDEILDDLQSIIGLDKELESCRTILNFEKVN